MYPLAVSALSFEGTTNLGYDETHIIAHGHGKSGDIYIHTHTKSRQAGIDTIEKQCRLLSYQKPQATTLCSLFKADYVLLGPTRID